VATTTSSLHIKANREAVWIVLTDPTYVRQWQYGSVLETDWTVGSPIRFTTEVEGKIFEQWGTVLAVDALREARYTLFAPRPGLADSPENYFTMTYGLASDSDGTLVTITREDPRPGAPETDGDGDDESPVLTALRDLAESI